MLKKLWLKLKNKFNEDREISPVRLRIGVLLVLLWWLPIWLLAPAFDSLFGVDSSQGKHILLVSLLIIQTILGLAGVLIAGKQVMIIFKETPKKKLPGRVFHIMFSKSAKT